MCTNLNNNDAKPAPEKTRRKPITGPIFASVFYPGAGQIMQGRYVLGGIFLLAFTLLLGMFLFYAFGIIITYYRLMDFSNQIDSETPLREMLLAFGSGLIVWVINIIDALRGYQRQRKAYRQQQAARFQQFPMS